MSNKNYNANKNANDIANKINTINNKLEKVDETVVNSVANNSKVLDNINNKIEKINEKLDEPIPNINIPRNIHIDEKDLLKPIGILDPEGKELNPLTGEEYQNFYTDAKKYPGTYLDFAYKEKDGKKSGWSVLPMYSQRDEILQLVHENQVILIISSTGSGKTVLLPKFLLHTLNYQGKIIVTNPKTVPTKSAAEYAAKCLDVPLGKQVGFAFKGEKETSVNTKLFYVTDGLVLAWLQSDPLLSEYDAIIVDEIHERSVQIDLLLFRLKHVLKYRKDFKVIIMSATIDPKPFIDYYKDFGIKDFEAKGESYFPIEEIFLENPINKLAPNGEIISTDFVEKTVKYVIDEILLKDKEGDILVFMPGKKNCDDFCHELEIGLKKETSQNKEFANKPLCIQLTSSSKKKTLRNATEKNYAVGNKNYKNWEDGYTRRIISATNIAESSITFSGDAIMHVVDTGLSNEQRYYPDTGMSALELRYISVANHKQRRGRTGRIGPGFCHNMFTKDEYENRKIFLEYPEPPIVLTDITPTILLFMSMVSHVNLPFKYPAKKPSFDADPATQSLNEFLMNMITLPHENYISESLRTLFMLDAIKFETKEKASITPIGRGMLKLIRNASVQMTRAIIEGFNYRCGKELIDIASVLENIEGRMDSLIDKFRSKAKKNSPELKKEKAHYDKVVKNLASPYGDFISIYNIIHTYINKKYFVRWERGREKLVSRSNGTNGGPNPANIWAKENFINKTKLENAIKKSRKELDRGLGMIIRDIKRAEQEGGDNSNNSSNNGNYNNSFIASNNSYNSNNTPLQVDIKKRFLLFREEEPVLHDKLEDNIIQALMAGYATNIVHKVGKNYATCFHKVQTMAGIDRGSLFNYASVKPTSCFYDTYFGIRGVKRLSIVSKIPEKVVKEMSSIKREIISECAKKLKSSPISSPRGNSHKKRKSKFIKHSKSKERRGKSKGRRSKK